MRKLIARIWRKLSAEANAPAAEQEVDPAWTQPGSFTVHVPHSDVPKSRRFDSPLATFITSLKDL